MKGVGIPKGVGVKLTLTSFKPLLKDHFFNDVFLTIPFKITLHVFQCFSCFTFAQQILPFDIDIF